MHRIEHWPVHFPLWRALLPCRQSLWEVRVRDRPPPAELSCVPWLPLAPLWTWRRNTGCTRPARPCGPGSPCHQPRAGHHTGDSAWKTYREIITFTGSGLDHSNSLICTWNLPAYAFVLHQDFLETTCSNVKLAKCKATIILRRNLHIKANSLRISKEL